MLLTDDELAIITLAGSLFTKFCDLPEHHPCDVEEMTRLVHQIQEKVMARAAIRGLPAYGWTPFRTRACDDQACHPLPSGTESA